MSATCMSNISDYIISAVMGALYAVCRYKVVGVQEGFAGFTLLRSWREVLASLREGKPPPGIRLQPQVFIHSLLSRTTVS